MHALIAQREFHTGQWRAETPKKLQGQLPRNSLIWYPPPPTASLPSRLITIFYCMPTSIMRSIGCSGREPPCPLSPSLSAHYWKKVISSKPKDRLTAIYEVHELSQLSVKERTNDQGGVCVFFSVTSSSITSEILAAMRAMVCLETQECHLFQCVCSRRLRLVVYINSGWNLHIDQDCIGDSHFCLAMQ